jgi:hypothetical protein
LIGRNSRFWQNILSNMAKSRSKSWPLTLRRPESGVHFAVLTGGQKSGPAIDVLSSSFEEVAPVQADALRLLSRKPAGPAIA